MLLNYDNAGADHLSLAGERGLRAISEDLVLSRSVADDVAFFAKKILYVLFFTPLDLAQGPANDRSLRILELILAGVGFWACRRHLVAWLLAAGVVLQTGQLMPLLYTQRYSIGALELPLIILAGVGFAVLGESLAGEASGRPRLSRWWVLTMLGATIAAVAAGNVLRQIALPEPALTGYPSQVLLDLVPAAGAWTALPDGRQQLDVDIPALTVPAWRNLIWDVRMSVSSAGGTECRHATLIFARQPSTEVPGGGEVGIRIVADGSERHYAVGAARDVSPVSPAAPGVLRLRLDCGQNAVATGLGIRLIESQIYEYYDDFLVRRLGRAGGN